MPKRKTSDYTPDPTNANSGTERGLRALDDSLAKYGAGRSILVDKNGYVIAGNKTLERAVDSGFDEVIEVETDGRQLVAVKRTDLDLINDPRARELAYADNRVAELDLTWNAEQLLADLNAGVDLSQFWNEHELQELLDGLVSEPPVDAGAQVDKAAELQEKWQVARGDLWTIGKHRLLCGDSTNADDVARVMGGERAAICFTSPPYNAGVSAKLRGNTSIGASGNMYGDNGYDDNQSQDDYLDLLRNFTDAVLPSCEYLFCNLQMLAGNKIAFVEYLFQYRERLADIAIWNKRQAAPAAAVRVMDSHFEFVLVFSDDATRAIGTREFRGLVSNVYESNAQHHNEVSSSHGATFPVEFPSHFIENFTNRRDTVIDPFCGSGTTLVACEQLGRQGRGIEISEPYCAVILQRMFDLTGLTPTRE